MRAARAAAAVCALAGRASAIGETMFEGVVDYAKSSLDSHFRHAAGLVAQYVTANPDLKAWPTMTAVHDSFAWIGGFFMLALSYQGLRYVMSADSPGGRAASKAAVQRMIVGMVFVSLNGYVFTLGLEVSGALTDALVADAVYNSSANVELLFLASSFGIACAVLPLGVLAIFALLLAVVFRYMLVLILWGLFPLILAAYFSQVGFLARLGGRGVSLYLSAVLANPIMALLFKISIDLLNAAADPSTASWNVTDKFLAYMMALAGLAAAALSPLLTFGLLGSLGAVTSAAAAAAGAVFGGAAAAGVAGGLVTSSSGSVRDSADAIVGQGAGMRVDLREAAAKAEEALRKGAATKVAASEDHVGSSSDGRLRYMASVLSHYDSLLADGVIREDDRGRIRVGDAGKELAKKDASLTEGYEEMAAPFGRGFGDSKGRAVAEERGLLSDDRIVLRNAVHAQRTVGGKGYHVAVNEAGGLYNVVVQSEGKASAYAIGKSAELDSRERVIERIFESQGDTPFKAAGRLSRLRPGV
jgi:hypothetical protein